MNKLLNQRFFVTTPIYYVNDVPHVGHAYTTLAADVLARYWREKLGKENVFFLTGTDEHGQKVAQAAQEKNISPKQYVDKVAPRFKEAWELLNIHYDYFIRTTDPNHEKVVIELLQKIYDNDFIYEGIYKGLYCVGCERFLAESDLFENRCPLHPNKPPVYQEEKNYFLKLKDLSKEILKRIESKKYEILPEKRKNEIVSKLKMGVEDISISRAGVSWGIPVPWDKSQTIYVWVDALINYYSATRFVQGKEKFWPADLHLVGKDILWFHTVIWQALLIAAGIDLPKTIFGHGFFTIDGQKMSKSLGNVISPKQLVNKYGVDGSRYLILSAYPFGEDGDLSISKFDQKYNSDLANGLGNLVARVAKLLEINRVHMTEDNINEFHPTVSDSIESYRFEWALEDIWKRIKDWDVYLDSRKPWEKKSTFHQKVIWQELIDGIRQIAFDLKPFLPETAERIEKQFLGPRIRLERPLFPRLP